MPSAMSSTRRFLRLGRIAAVEQHEVIQACGFAPREPQVGEADEFPLVHGNAARQMVQIFAGRDLQGELFGFAELAFSLQPGGEGGEFAQRGGIGGEPGKAMGGMLLGIQTLRLDPATRHDACCNPGLRLDEQALRQRLPPAPDGSPDG